MTFKLCRLKTTRNAELFTNLGRVIQNRNKISFLLPHNIFSRKHVKINLLRRLLVANKLLILRKKRKRVLVLVDETDKNSYVEICFISRKFAKIFSKKYFITREFNAIMKFRKNMVITADILQIAAKSEEQVPENPTKKQKLSPSQESPNLEAKGTDWTI